MIWVVLAVALFLRIIILNQSLWLDEAINVLAASHYSFWDFLTKYSIGDFHPPGYFALLWVWERIGGTSEVWVRIPSVALGLGAVFITYLLGKEIFSKKIGLIAALLLAIAPLHVYYSQEARMYSLSAFAATLSFYFFNRLISKGSKVNMLGYITATVLVLYADYLVYLIIPVQILFTLIYYRAQLKRVLISLGVSLLFLTPWLTVFPKQLSVGTGTASTLPGWANVVGGSGVKDLLLVFLKTLFGRISFDNKYIYVLVAGLAGLMYLIAIFKLLKKPDNASKLLLSWLFIPVALAFVVSFFIPVLAYFRMIFILPAFYLLVAKGISLIYNKWLNTLLLISICLISLSSLLIYYTNPKFQREDWRTAIKEVESRSTTGSVVLFETNGAFSPAEYYSTNTNLLKAGLKKVPALNEEDVVDISQKEVYQFEYLVDVTDPKRFLQAKLNKLGYKETEILNYPGVGFVHHFKLQ
jgi:mannosyltransferase